MWKERAGGGCDQMAAAERVSRPLLPAPVKGQRSRHSGEGAAPGCDGAAVEQAGSAEDKGAGADDTQRIQAAQEGEHRGILELRWPAEAAADDRHRRAACRRNRPKATTVRPPARATGPAACAIVTASIAGKTRAGHRDDANRSPYVDRLCTPS
jgi:hypothetical protein